MYTVHTSKYKMTIQAVFQIPRDNHHVQPPEGQAPGLSGQAGSCCQLPKF